MKKIILSLVLIGFGFSANAQDESSDYFRKNNEVSLDLVRTLFGQFLDVSYEKVLQEDLGVGANFGFSLANKSKDEIKPETLFQITPFVNWYFGGNTSSTKKYASGFFLQANISLNIQRDRKLEDLPPVATTSSPSARSIEEIKSTNFGAGAAIGWKYVSKNNWIGTVYIGGGKNFYKSYKGSPDPSSDKNFFDLYSNTGISIGKRF